MFLEKRLSKSKFQYTAVRSPGNVIISWQEVIQALSRGDQEVIAELTTTLDSSPFNDFFWECSPVSSASTNTPFQFVLISAGGHLASRGASPYDFQEHFRAAKGKAVTAFYNLGKDAMLVVPTHAKGCTQDVYGHLAAFTRSASEEQQLELWQRVGIELDRELKKRKGSTLWLNTEGSGVPWLHVRLDQRPKYISHGPYRDPHYGETIEIDLPRDQGHFAGDGNGKEPVDSLKKRAKKKQPRTPKAHDDKPAQSNKHAENALASDRIGQESLDCLQALIKKKEPIPSKAHSDKPALKLMHKETDQDGDVQVVEVTDDADPVSQIDLGIPLPT